MTQTAEKLEVKTYSRLEQRNRRLGELALGHELRLRNNDPLAHVFLRLEASRLSEVESQIRAEYRGDMSERSDITTKVGESAASKERPFYNFFDYRLEGDDLIYEESGKSLKQLLRDGEAAARSDFEIEPENYNYHLKRAQVLAAHGPAMVAWRKSNPDKAAQIASLCPSTEELPSRIAKKGSYKQHRLMASMWLLESTAEGIRMHVFSLDQLTLPRLQKIYDELGVEAAVENSTLAEVAQIRPLHVKGGAKAVADIIDTHDKNLDDEMPQGHHYHGIATTTGYLEETYRMVEEAPEAEVMYLEAVEEIAQSWLTGQNSTYLNQLVGELADAFKDDADIPAALKMSNPPTIDQAREFMDYLRGQVLSEHIFGDKEAHQQFSKHSQELNNSSGYGAVAAAGSYAVAHGIERGGDCPSSINLSNSVEHSNANVAATMGLHNTLREEFDSEWCPNCLPKKKAGKKVRAYRQGDKIGCKDCGHEIDICTKQVTKKGRKSSPKNSKGLFDILFGGQSA